MNVKSTTLSFSACAVLLIALGSCRKERDQYYSESGLRAYHTYRCDTVVHDGPMRMYTQTGEVTDQAVINQYLGLHPCLKAEAGNEPEVHPYNIYPGNQRVVYYNGLVPFTTTVKGEAIDMVEADTSVVTSTQNVGGSAVLYGYQQSYYDMLHMALDMQGSYTALNRLSPESYSTAESLHITGSYKNETVTIPYTFVGSRAIWNSYPLPVKAGALPTVPAGDTLLVLPGHVSFHL